MKHTIDNFTYICDTENPPKLNSFVIQGQVKRVYFYTNNKINTKEWFENNEFSRKFKIDNYTRQIIFTNDKRIKLL